MPPEMRGLRRRDDLVTPTVLTRYPASILSPACSLQATSEPPTATYTSTRTVTYRTRIAVETEIITEPVANKCTWFKLRISAPGTIIDGSFLAWSADQPGVWLRSSEYASGSSYYFDSLRYRLDAATGYIETLAGNLFGIWLGTPFRSGNLALVSLATFDPYYQQFYNEPVPWTPSRCAVDPYTREVTWKNTGIPDHLHTNFYIDNVPRPYNFYMGVADPYPGGPKLYVRAKLYAHCTIPELEDGRVPCSDCYNNLA
jgi:hypothetical protein